jgi:hypothetical protein
MTKTNTEIDLSINSDHDLDEINNKMNTVMQHISNEMIKLTKYIENIKTILDTTNINASFEEQELIEEYFDKLIHEYNKSKPLFKQGREIRIYKEAKEREILNQKRFARNVLVHYGIQHIN